MEIVDRSTTEETFVGAVESAIERAIEPALSAPGVDAVLEEEGLTPSAVATAAQQVAVEMVRTSGRDLWPESTAIEPAVLALRDVEDRIRREYVGSLVSPLFVSPLTTARVRRGGTGSVILGAIGAAIDIAGWLDIPDPVVTTPIFGGVLVLFLLGLDTRRVHRREDRQRQRRLTWAHGEEKPPRRADKRWIEHRSALAGAIATAATAAEAQLSPTWVNLAIERLRSARTTRQVAEGTVAPGETSSEHEEGPPTEEDAVSVIRRERLVLSVPVERLGRLTEADDLSLLVTTSMQRLRERAERHPTGATIGVAGERGVGKSGVLLWAKDTALKGTGDGLGVLLSFSTRYDAMTMVTAILSELVHRVIDEPPSGLGAGTEVRALRPLGIKPRDPIERSSRRRAEQRRRADTRRVRDPGFQRAAFLASLVAIAAATQLWSIAPLTAGTLRAYLAVLIGWAVLRIDIGGRPRLEPSSEEVVARRVPPHLLVHDPRPRTYEVAVARRAMRALGVLLIVFGIGKWAVGAWTAAVGVEGVPSPWRTWAEEGLPPGSHLPIVLSTTLVVVVFASLTTRRLRWVDDGEVDLPDPLGLETWVDLAIDGQAVLERLTFQTTSTQEVSSTLQLTPFAWLVGSYTRGRSSERAERPVTVPEAVRLFHGYCGRVAAHYGHVVIGIDELDKIADPAEAELCLNDLKALFSVADTYFLISVSTSALAAFERRGIPLRDAFDSSLDDIVAAEEFDLDTTSALITQRVPGGLPDPFTWVVIAITGGLPRDVLRLLRDLGDIRPGPPDLDVRHATLVLVARERVRRGQATSQAVGDPRDVEAARVLRRLTGSTEDWAEDALDQLAAICPSTSAGASAYLGFLAYASLLDTVAALIERCADEAGTTVSFAHADVLEGQDPAASLDVLVLARRRLSAAPESVLGLLSRFRVAWGMDALPVPAAPAEPTATDDPTALQGDGASPAEAVGLPG